MSLWRKLRTLKLDLKNRALFDREQSFLSPECLRLLSDSKERGARREDFIALVDVSGANLIEIGPYFAPAFSGANVKYFDVFTYDELVENARQDPDEAVAPEKIPAIHYHDSSGDLSQIPDRFDNAFSSHCIEHQPDLIKHLNQVCELLRPGGRYYVIVPDKRFCFDHLMPETSVSEVIQASHEKRCRHSLKSVIDHYSQMTHNDPLRHWSGDHVDPGWHQESAQRTRRALDLYESAGDRYIDAHAWKFTPARFLQILSSLHDMGMVGLRPEQVWSTPACRFEFTAILVRD